jgi:ribonucleoside-diphosphate reductase alpha chain
MPVDTNIVTRHEASVKDAKALTGLQFTNMFSHADSQPFDDIEWEKREALIVNEKGDVVFEQKNLEIPKHFSQLATNVVVSKYFKGKMDTPERESSLKQVVGRVANTITAWGKKDKIFASEEDADTFNKELTSLLVNQKMAFNSPVWFNVGVESHPQCSACFINSVEDKMESILELAKTEGMLFKYGSGAGVNLSPLRGSNEGMTHGGQASGPVSFMRGYDSFAGVIKSGGKTRRAAKMVILNIDHPDIQEFIECKTKEEAKAKALIAQGYDSSFNGEAYGSVFYQNANHSARVTDEFMKAVVNDEPFMTRSVLPPHDPVATHNARELMDKVAEAAWQTGDPGIQYDTTINDWHTCPKTDRIHASNPCSEYMFLNNSACNLASLNLMKFRMDDGKFNVKAYRAAVRVTITAMEIIVGNASYPTKQIEKNSHDFRPLGLGYANLGALLMSLGMPYDSDEGRAYAASVTALMHGEAYRTSAEIAGVTGPFKGFTKNRRPMMRVIRKHANAVDGIDSNLIPPYMIDEVENVYDEMIQLGERNGFRHSQATVLAPTGTISFMMDCDTTGIEPDILLIKTKKLVGGGSLQIVNRTVPLALRELGYSDSQVQKIVDYVDEHHHMVGAPGLKDEHLPVFDCALDVGGRSINYMGHIKMMAAAQPFLSGAISKTVNMPYEATVDEIKDVYLQGWQMGLKAIAIYRNGCKGDEPISSGLKKTAVSTTTPTEKIVYKPYRRKLADERHAITHKFSIGGYEGYITAGLYDDGQPGEIFIVMSKEGSFISGLMDGFATSVSIALQYGVPLQVLVRKFIHTRFEPNGFTGNKDIPIAHSVMDYVFRWLSLKFLPPDNAGQEQLFDDPEGPDGLGDDFSGNGGQSSGGSGPTGGSPTQGSNGPTASSNGIKVNGKDQSKGNGQFNLHTNRHGKVVLKFNETSNGNGNGNGNGKADKAPNGNKNGLANGLSNGHTSSHAGNGGGGKEIDSFGTALESDFELLPPMPEVEEDDYGTNDLFMSSVPSVHDDTPMCPECGSTTMRNGSCHTCMTCGATTGCG